MLVHQIGVTYVIFFLRRRDLAAAEESLTFIEDETSNLLPHCEYQADATSIVQGSALKALDGYRQWKAKIIELKGPLDIYVSE